jgi:hypothetical protein
METIGKILSLTLFVIFGAAAGVVYLADSDFSPESLFKNDSVSNSNEYKDIDVSSHRKRLLDNYLEERPSGETHSKPQKQKELWTNTYDDSVTRYSTSEEVKRLAEENSLSELREKMDYWYDRYDKAIQSGRRQGANEAYRKYKNYKEALRIKERLK